MLYVVGVDGLTSFISVEPYSSRIKGRQGNKGTEDSVLWVLSLASKGKAKKLYSDMNVNPEVGIVGGGFTLVFL